MRWVSVACAVALAGACGGGGGDAKAGKPRPLRDSLPARIRQTGVITVGSDIEYAPLEFFGAGSATPQGFDVDLANAIAKRLGVQARFVNFTDLEGLLPALVAGRFDLVMSGLSDTPERRASGVAFIDYLMAGTSILVPKGNPKAVQSLDDLCGQTVAVQKDAEQDTQTVPDQSAACRAAGRPELNAVALASDAAALEQLRGGRVAAMLTDAAVAGYYAKTTAGGTAFDETGAPAGGGTYGIAVASSSTELRDALAKALAAVTAAGTYRTLLEKWGLTRAGLETPTVKGRRVVPSGGRAPVRPRCCA
ncbi:MAG: ABC transporter substrate-binding protein [Actinobacteria bacterium]|nr:MAG: ABC transporter substrate-binding protein [Actinomycetota bacterium]